jgi:hypothetical protein
VYGRALVVDEAGSTCCRSGTAARHPDAGINRVQAERPEGATLLPTSGHGAGHRDG